MEILTCFAILFTAALMGMRVEYARGCMEEPGIPVSRVWAEKRTWFAALGWIVIFFGCFILSGWNLTIIRMLDLLVCYLLLAAIDWKWRVVPEYLLICLLAGQLLLGAAAELPMALLGTFLSGGIFFLVLLMLARVLKNGLGLGDVKLLGVTAMVAGWTYAVVIFGLALVLSLVFGIWLLVVKGKSVKTEVPFVPFLALAMLVHIVLTMIL